MGWLIALVVLVVAAFGVSFPFMPAKSEAGPEWRALNGTGNNEEFPNWGEGNRPYLRVASFSYADGIAEMSSGPPPRYVSNRVFNDLGQNLFSENGVSQWGWVWGQFLDHTFGLRERKGRREGAYPLRRRTILSSVSETTSAQSTSRARRRRRGPASRKPRQQINTVPSLIDAFAVYGGTNARLEWLREGTINGNVTDNSASLFLPGGYLPHADERGAPRAPTMQLMGPLVGRPASAIVAGDVRANENIALTAVHTLFAREHNRIVVAPAGIAAE